MADSLTIAGVIELMGGGVPSVQADAQGAVFYLGRDFDLGAPQMQAELAAGLLLDGEQVISTRASNRTATIPVVIKVPSTGDALADALTLAAARELLLQTAAQERWELVWTRDQALPLVFDCQGLSSVVLNHSVFYRRALCSLVEITFQALPYGRSDDEERILVAAPSQIFDQPPAPVSVDLFGTAVNFLTGDASTFAVGIAGWVATSGCSVARTTAQTHSAPGALVMTATGAGAMVSQHARSGLTIVDDGRAMACQPGDVITARGFSRAATVARSVNVGVIFTDDNGAPVGSTLRGSNVTNLTTAFTAQPTASVTCPPGASWAIISPQVLAAAGAGEAHYWDDLYLDRGTVNSANDPGNWSPSTVTAVTGRGSALWQRVLGDSPVYQRVLSAPIDITGRTKLSFWLGLATTQSAYKNWHKGQLQLRVTLTDSTGDVITFGARNVRVQASSLQKKPHWQFMSAHIPQAVPQFDYSSVAAYSVQVWNTWNGYLKQPVLQASAYLCSVRATAGSDGSPGTRGAWYTLPGVVGSARAPLAIQAAPGPSGFSTIVEFPAGVINWTAPAGVSVIDKVESFAAGGGGPGGVDEVCGGGGAGGGEYAMDPNVGVTPLAAYHGQAGAAGLQGTGGPVGLPNDATGGGDSWFIADLITTYAHGGMRGWHTDGLWGGGKGGSGSNSYLHNNGGDGYQSNAVKGRDGGRGGAGGGGGGPSSPGNDGNSNSPTPAVSGSGPGGAGGWLSGTTAQVRGSSPTSGPGGGGGGGSDDNTGAGHNGAGGADGKVRLTYGASGLLPMNSLLVHLPSPEAPPALSPLVSVGGGSDSPNGTTEYTFPAISALPARFDGSYSLWLTAATWSSPSSSRDLTVTVKQYAYAGGPSTTLPMVRKSVTPSADIVNGYVEMGILTLPLWDLPPGNTDSYFVVTVLSSLTADRFNDVIMIDTQGTLVFVNMPGTAFANSIWFDEAELGRDVGRILASDADRDRARSIAGSDPSNRISGGPLVVRPGSHNRVLVYQGIGCPAVTFGYLPRWWAERLS